MIPKIIHQTYPHKPLPPMLRDNAHQIAEMNPDWEYRHYTDGDINQYIYDAYGSEILSLYSRINPAYGAARADFFRYLVLYAEGGFYIDIKGGMTRPLNSLLPPTLGYLLLTWPDRKPYDTWGQHAELEGRPEFCQWVLGCNAGHPLMKRVIERISHNISNYKSATFGVGKIGTLRTTGPIAYTLAIRDHVEEFNTSSFDFERRGLRYSIFSTTRIHERIFDPHYSKLTSPVIL